jgi:signal transduction histidine kinase
MNVDAARGHSLGQSNLFGPHCQSNGRSAVGKWLFTFMLVSMSASGLDQPDILEAVYYSHAVPRNPEVLTALGLIFDRIYFPGVYMPPPGFDQVEQVAPTDSTVLIEGETGESRKREEERVRQENVRLEERTRIAQELHDTLLQNFLSASMQLGATVNGVPSDSPVKVRLDRILQLMEQGIEDGRKALQGLRLSDTAPLDLVQAFSGIQRELAVPSDVEFRVTVIGEERPLHLGIQHQIYRIGREALINAFRHSRATRVEVDLEYADSELRMRVRDNGCGVDPRVLETGHEGHWGLAGMQERAAKIGGLLKICSNATGTEIELSLPLM